MLMRTCGGQVAVSAKHNDEDVPLWERILGELAGNMSAFIEHQDGDWRVFKHHVKAEAKNNKKKNGADNGWLSLGGTVRRWYRHGLAGPEYAQRPLSSLTRRTQCRVASVTLMWAVTVPLATGGLAGRLLRLGWKVVEMVRFQASSDSIFLLITGWGISGKENVRRHGSCRTMTASFWCQRGRVRATVVHGQEDCQLWCFGADGGRMSRIRSGKGLGMWLWGGGPIFFFLRVLVHGRSRLHA